MSDALSEFAAREPALGYFYQVRYALFLLLANRELTNPVLRIENLDDIEIQTVDKIHLYQTKLKLRSKANLTDASVDFWKTIRVWSESIKNGLIDPNTTIFTLITTESVPDDSLIHDFKVALKNDKQLTSTITKMDVVATTSTNIVNKSAYDAYLNLSVNQKKTLLKNINIVDSAVDVNEVTKKIRAELAFSCPPNQIEAFLELLEGWWFQNAIKLLLGQNEGVSFQELQFKVSDIRDSFSQDNLPNHFNEQLDISDQEAKDQKDKNYLKQLELISIGIASNTAKRAISDFRRAFEQRSKWLRLELLSPDDQSKYDQRLYDHWKNLFDILQDECESQTMDQIKEIGKKFYLNQFIKNCPPIRIRDRFNEDYLTRGSYQILSDCKRIGWHPNYEDLIA